ncbi:hypothetical protein SLEP1_g27449 [Rubroshorea leprosula]|uniref:F-box domain-containing protein n=1 Tax=Rubroshorea leprosula TaxID=152421 RepID=A0AAV5JZ55_9ROSI|nr:hypothetical protein SLEP1_g27449 [Rubroshorea leprosula]
MSETISSAEAVAGSQDILIQIFLRLPAKSLLKFRCVCKDWLSLISLIPTRQFALTHTLLNPQTPVALLLDDYILPLNPQRDDPLPIFEAPFADLLDVPWFKAAQSCNGLLLVSPDFNVETSGTDTELGIGDFICNPTTKECKKIPPRPKQIEHYPVEGYALAFDPVKSLHYKVICVRCVGIDRHRHYLEKEIDIYSSETDSWRICNIAFIDENNMEYRQPVFCNGTIYWYALSSEALYFDVEEESLKSYPMPSYFENVSRLSDLNSMIKYFNESRGHLHLITQKELKFLVFELAADHSEWSVKYNFRLEAAGAMFPEVIDSLEKHLVNVLTVIREEKEEDSVVVFSVGHVIFSYNLETKAFKKLSDCDCGSDFLRDCLLPWDYACQYFASFACV